MKMKKRWMNLALALFLVLGLSAMAAATEYTSTFSISHTDFALSGFSAYNSSTGNWEATGGPDTLVLDDPQGSYSLNLPPATGNYDWWLDIDGLYMWFGPGQDGQTGTSDDDELLIPDLAPIYIGSFPVPTSWSGSYNVGDYYVPSYAGIGGYTLENVVVGWDVEFTSTTGVDKITLTLAADNLAGTLNKDLTDLDDLTRPNLIDGYAKGQFSITATPEPSTILLMGLGLLGLVGLGRRRRK